MVGLYKQFKTNQKRCEICYNYFCAVQVKTNCIILYYIDSLPAVISIPMILLNHSYRYTQCSFPKFVTALTNSTPFKKAMYIPKWCSSFPANRVPLEP